ncbi:MAG: pirin family protein [Pelolinea sp.]|nr:pirin family protein [Pelolinea sp.]
MDEVLMTTRTIRKTYPGMATLEGAGVQLTRIFSQPDVEELDPFLLLDLFDSDNPDDYQRGFPWHPHRGIETITYLIEGEIEHGDSLGNKGVIRPLGCQWMTAGRSIIHQEMPNPKERILGTQLWLNLPRANKMTEPAYRDIQAKDLAVVEDEQMHVKILAGTFRGKTGPVKGTYVDPIYFDVTIHAKGKFEIDIPAEEKVFLFLLERIIQFPDGSIANVEEERGVLLSEGDQVMVHSEKGARFLLIAGKPLHEPIAWGGPIVMNTQEELRHAFKEIQDGDFIKD